MNLNFIFVTCTNLVLIIYWIIRITNFYYFNNYFIFHFNLYYFDYSCIRVSYFKIYV